MLFWLVFLPLIGGLLGYITHVITQKVFANRVLSVESEHLKSTSDESSPSPQTQTSKAQPTQTNSAKLAYVELLLTKISANLITLKQKLKQELYQSSPVWVALIFMTSALVIAIILAFDALWFDEINAQWLQVLDLDWIPLFGIRFYLVLDGLSLVMMLLTIVITIIALIYSRKENHNHQGLFYLCLLFMASAVMCFFVVMDLFLLFFLWEAVVIPVYFLISLWGRRDSNAQLRINGASKFLIYTQITSLLMLISFVSLSLIHWNLSGEWTFDYTILAKTPISSYVEFLLMLGVLIAFVVRVPLVPFHGWFIEAHIESSTTGSIMVSGLLVNTAIYGILRFVLPLFPNAILTITPIMVCLSLLTLFYTAFLAFNQTDIKKLIAYIHIALVGLMSAAIYSASLVAYQGLILEIVAVSLVIVGLFMISGLLSEHYSTRNIKQFIELKSRIKYLSTLILFFILSILGIPGTANFVANLTILLGEYQVLPVYTVLLAIGLFLLSISIIVKMQPIFYGTNHKSQQHKLTLSLSDLLLLITILLILTVIGLYPQWIFDLSAPTINKLQQIMYSAQIDLAKGNV